MAAFNMKIRDVSIGVEMGLWEDDCGNPCVYLKNPDDEYLSCHEDGKHVFWHDTEDPWSWEMWYPVVDGDKVYLKSCFDTHMTCDDDDSIWQTDETDKVYLKMSQSDLDKLTIEKEEDDEEIDEDVDERSRHMNIRMV